MCCHNAGPGKARAYHRLLGGTTDVMRELLIAGAGCLHALEEFASSGYCNAVLFVRGDQGLIACMCSTIACSRKTREIETEHSFNLAFCGTFLQLNSSVANLTVETVRRQRSKRLDRTLAGLQVCQKCSRAGMLYTLTGPKATGIWIQRPGAETPTTVFQLR